MSVPKLRFKNDDGNEFPELKNVTLGAIAEIKRGAASQHLKYVDNEFNGIRLIRINDFLKNEPVYVEATEDIKRFTLKRNDLLIAGTGATAGIVFRVPDEFDNLAYSYNAPRIRVHNANNGFVYFHLLSDVVLQQQKSLFVGNAQPFLDTDAIRGFKIALPSSAEQTKIANFLTAVDEKITQLTQKHKLLNQYKKGAMQKIFSQELRFKDDDGSEFPEWDEISLSNLCSIQKGKQLNKSELTKFDIYPVINGGQEPSGYSDSWNTIANTITISEGGNSCGFVNFLIQNFWCGGHCYNLANLKNNVNKYFLYQTLKFNEPKIMKLRVGSGLPNIQKPALENFLIFLPQSIIEQTKIANFLKAIDDKIIATQSQLELVKQYKQGLLQQMFV